MNSATDKGIAPWTGLEGFSTRNFRYSGRHLTALFSTVANRQMRLANDTSNGPPAWKKSKRSRNLRGEVPSQESAHESRSQGEMGEIPTRSGPSAAISAKPAHWEVAVSNTGA